jgi:polar amino acid transport system substrate-binding protein
MEAVSTGKINAAMASTPGPEIAMKHAGARIYRPLADPIETMDENMVIRKGDVDFLNYLNTWIRYYERNGWLKKKREYWFGSTDWVDQL